MYEDSYGTRSPYQTDWRAPTSRLQSIAHWFGADPPTTLSKAEVDKLKQDPACDSSMLKGAREVVRFRQEQRALVAYLKQRHWHALAQEVESQKVPGRAQHTPASLIALTAQERERAAAHRDESHHNLAAHGRSQTVSVRSNIQLELTLLLGRILRCIKRMLGVGHKQLSKQQMAWRAAEAAAAAAGISNRHVIARLASMVEPGTQPPSVAELMSMIGDVEGCV